MERRLEQTGAGVAVDAVYQGRARPLLILTSIKFLLTASGINNLFVISAKLADLVQPDKLLTKILEEDKSDKE